MDAVSTSQIVDILRFNDNSNDQSLKISYEISKGISFNISLLGKTNLTSCFACPTDPNFCKYGILILLALPKTNFHFRCFLPQIHNFTTHMF